MRIMKPQVRELSITVFPSSLRNSEENIVHNRKFVPKTDESRPKKELLQHMRAVIRVMGVDGKPWRSDRMAGKESNEYRD